MGRVRTSTTVLETANSAPARKRRDRAMLEALRVSFHSRWFLYLWAVSGIAGSLLYLAAPSLAAQIGLAQNKETPLVHQAAVDEPAKTLPNLQTSQEWNQRLKELVDTSSVAAAAGAQDYRIGFDDVLDINVFEAQELNREVRVSSAGEISLPLLESVHAAGLTPRELELVLEALLRRTYMKDPHVSVFVREMQSHPVSVLGAVRRPGVFQIRGSKTLLEILSLAEGLADDAGETVIILRGAGLQNEASSAAERYSLTKEVEESAASSDEKKNTSPAEGIVPVNLKDLLDSSDVHQNPIVNPGDIVKVLRAGIVYAVGEVQRPGGFTMKSNEKMSVLQVIALSGGLTRTASKAGARIIRMDERSGERSNGSADSGHA